MSTYRIIIGVICLLISQQVLGIIPLENIILKRLTDQIDLEKEDPLNYVFRPEVNVMDLDDIEGEFWKQTFQYRGFIWEGENLTNYCHQNTKVLYTSKWNRDQVKRAMATTLQYIGLDLSIRNIANYAKYFDFNNIEFENLANRLTKNYCSKNITVVSLKEIRNNLNAWFEREGPTRFLQSENNPFFLKGLLNIADENTRREQGFLQEIKLFRSLCSWNGEPENFRMMTPYLKHPVIMAFIIRQLTMKKIKISLDEKLVLTEDDETKTVACDNLICRERSKAEYLRLMPRSIGGVGLEDDMKRLYCEDLRAENAKDRGQPPEVQKWMKAQTLDEQTFLALHLISNITGIPDFLQWTEKFTDGKNLLRIGVDDSWNTWATEALKQFSDDIYYEEYITIERLARSYFPRKLQRPFAVDLEVSLGEWDRGDVTNGKLKIMFPIKLSQRFLKYMQNEWTRLDPRLDKKRQHLLDVFTKNIRPAINLAKKRFTIVPWEKEFQQGFENLIVRDLIAQLFVYDGKALKTWSSEEIEIPVTLHYGPFALKYMRYRYQFESRQERGKLQALNKK